jgi:HAD superfamily hydrolase (TIGR01509 family)
MTRPKREPPEDERAERRTSREGAQRHGHTLQAVLWDMDGTLVDTEPLWIASEYELAEQHGATWSRQHALNLVGWDLLASGRYIRDHMALDMPAEEVVRLMLDRVVDGVRGGVEYRPGALELLAEQRRAGIPAALVTMSYRRLADAVVAGLPAGTFSAVVVGDEVYHGKPHPEPYLTAAALVGAAPAHCVAIEDSTTGASSAQAAGCHVLAVPHHVPVAPAPGRTVAPSLAGLRLADLESMLASVGASCG